jgi:GNAT superfamily N-acetyltransferase
MEKLNDKKHKNYTISTDKRKLDLEIIHDFLANTSYWAEGRPLGIVRESIENSLCFGIYIGTEQAGFARVVTDYVTFAWVCDLFILKDHRGNGLGKWLIKFIVAYPELQGLKNMLLATKDAHKMYRKYGDFEELSVPSKWMHRAT